MKSSFSRFVLITSLTPLKRFRIAMPKRVTNVKIRKNAAIVVSTRAGCGFLKVRRGFRFSSRHANSAIRISNSVVGWRQTGETLWGNRVRHNTKQNTFGGNGWVFCFSGVSWTVRGRSRAGLRKGKHRARTSSRLRLRARHTRRGNGVENMVADGPNVERVCICSQGTYDK